MKTQLRTSSQIEVIKKQLVKNTEDTLKSILFEKYECDKCKKDGDITNMVMIIGKGLFHAKCLKSKKY